MIKTIVFDFDGTLMDSMGMWHSLMGDYLKSKGVILTEDLEQMVVTTGFVKGMEKLNEIYHFEESPQDLLDDIGHIIIDNYLHHVAKKPYVDETLAFCRDQGYDLALASATSSDYLGQVLEKRGLDHFFKLVQTCDMVDLAKKDEAFYHVLAERLGRKPEEILFVDDAPYALETAQGVGIRVVAVYDHESKDLWDKGRFDQFESIRDLGELQGLVEKR